MNQKNPRPLQKIWSTTEKQKLLSILKSEGHANCEKIARSFPNKSASAIRAMINKYMVLAKSMNPGEQTPLDFWLHSYFSPESEKLIPRALLFTWLFEEQPTIEESNGIDFASIYELLYRLCSGDQGRNEISPETWAAFFNEISIAIDYIKKFSEREVLTYLSTLNNKEGSVKVYTKNKERILPN